MLLKCGVGEDSWESLGLQGDPISPSWRKSVLNIHWKDRCWSWNSNTLSTWCKELTYLKRSWCWERLRAGGEGDDRGWDGWMASPAQWAWVWVNSQSWWWTGRLACCSPWGRKESAMTERLDWTELNWTLILLPPPPSFYSPHPLPTPSYFFPLICLSSASLLSLLLFSNLLLSGFWSRWLVSDILQNLMVSHLTWLSRIYHDDHSLFLEILWVLLGLWDTILSGLFSNLDLFSASFADFCLLFWPSNIRCLRTQSLNSFPV